MVWTAYLDESGTHDLPIMLMGGYLSNDEQWKAFGDAWKTLLNREGIASCHAKDLFHSAKQFQGWTRQRREAFLRKASEVFAKTLKLGVTSIIRQNDYKELYKGQPNPRNLREDSMFGILFRGCLLVIESAVTGNKVPSKDLRLNFVMEGGHKNSGDVSRLFELAKKEHLPGCEHVLGTFTLGDKRTYGLQAADLLVYGANRLERKDHWDQPTDVACSPHVRQPGEPVGQGLKEYRLAITRKTLQNLHADFLLPENQRRNMQSR